MAYYKKEDFKVFIETEWNKYSNKYLHVLKLHKLLPDNKFEDIELYSSTKVTDDLDKAKKYLEEFENNFIVASSCEIDLNYPNIRKNYDTVWLVDFEKNTVRCLNGITGYESYFIKDILNFEGNIFTPCSGTKGSWNRLEINYPEFRGQLERIIEEYNKGIYSQEIYFKELVKWKIKHKLI
jgi:hypothetical protein